MLLTGDVVWAPGFCRGTSGSSLLVSSKWGNKNSVSASTAKYDIAKYQIVNVNLLFNGKTYRNHREKTSFELMYHYIYMQTGNVFYTFSERIEIQDPLTGHWNSSFEKVDWSCCYVTCKTAAYTQ